MTNKELERYIEKVCQDSFETMMKVKQLEFHIEFMQAEIKGLSEKVFKNE